MNHRVPTGNILILVNLSRRKICVPYLLTGTCTLSVPVPSKQGNNGLYVRTVETVNNTQLQNTKIIGVLSVDSG